MSTKKYGLYLLVGALFILLALSIGAGVAYGIKAPERYIYIDPGHGGFDGGAVSKDGLVYEKQLTLDISIKLKNKLERFGYSVLLTRYTDRSLGKTKREDILRRVELLESDSTIMYISIHANAYPSEAVHGAQVFYKDDVENKKLSNKIQSFLKEVDSTSHRTAKSITGKYLIDNTKKVGCLVEVGFLSSPFDLKNLQQKAYQDELVTMITLGIINYLGER